MVAPGTPGLHTSPSTAWPPCAVRRCLPATDARPRQALLPRSRFGLGWAPRVHQLIQEGRLYEQEHGRKRGRQRLRLVCARDHNGKQPKITTDDVPKRPTYRQDWPKYDAAQRTEKRRFQYDLDDAVD